jgi:hypothetical protein
MRTNGNFGLRVASLLALVLLLLLALAFMTGRKGAPEAPLGSNGEQDDRSTRAAMRPVSVPLAPPVPYSSHAPPLPTILNVRLTASNDYSPTALDCQVVSPLEDIGGELGPIVAGFDPSEPATTLIRQWLNLRERAFADANHPCRSVTLADADISAPSALLWAMCAETAPSNAITPDTASQVASLYARWRDSPVSTHIGIVATELLLNADPPGAEALWLEIHQSSDVSLRERAARAFACVPNASVPFDAEELDTLNADLPPDEPLLHLGIAERYAAMGEIEYSVASLALAAPALHQLNSSASCQDSPQPKVLGRVAIPPSEVCAGIVDNAAVLAAWLGRNGADGRALGWLSTSWASVAHAALEACGATATCGWGDATLSTHGWVWNWRSGSPDQLRICSQTALAGVPVDESVGVGAHVFVTTGRACAPAP